jgi:prepilin-type N-terminal cleavage/methylation domain-containing protein
MIGARSRGFTLIELIIVMVIMSLLAVLVTPRLTKSLYHLEVRGASKRISAILRYCRSESVNRSRIYSVSFDAPSHLLSVQSTDEGDEKSTLERTYSLPEEVQVEKIEVGKTFLESSLPTFEFYPNGGSNGGTALVKRVESRAYMILVDALTGTVKVEEAKQQ